MSWEDAIKNRIQITTGDGAVYEPLTTIESFTASFDFNISEFEFPEISGTKVDKRLRKGVRYPLELYFQGADCIEQGKAFAESANDKRPWVVIHPIFGQFTAHVPSIEMDARGLNVFKITCTAIETIIEDGAKTVFDPSQNSAYVLNRAKDANTATFEASIPAFEPTDVVLMKDNVSGLYESASTSIKDQTLFNEYTNLFNTATTKINNALSDANFGISFVQEFINYPAQFTQDIKNKISVIKAQALLFIDSVYNLNSSYNEKKIFENNKGALIGTLIEAISNPQDGDYQSAVDVFYVIEQSLGIYNQFISELQSLQSPNGYEPGAYLPSAEFLEALSYSFNYAIANLFDIALNAQQERTIYLEEDSNVIIQTHRFYGLQQDDSTLKRFVETNNIGINETLQLKKGRKLVYYV